MSRFTGSGGGTTIINNGGSEYDAIVAASGGDYTTVQAALDAGKKNILVKNGTYAGGFIVTTDNVQVTGQSTDGVIFEIAPSSDGVKIYANNTVMKKFTVDCETNDAEACYVVGDGQPTGSPDFTIGNFNKIHDCLLKGSAHIFAIYLAGASTNVGSDTLTAYENDDLADGNEVYNNTITSGWDGDSFSFSLQKNGSLRDNKMYGGRVAFYMCKNSSVTGNKVSDSLNHGIFVGAPTANNVISFNQIYRSVGAGIRVENQLEHTPLLTGQRAEGLVITDNTIKQSGYGFGDPGAGTGIELVGTSGHEPMGNTVANNVIDSPSVHGIYLQVAKQNTISNNTIVEPKQDPAASRGSGIYMVSNVTDNLIANNSIIDERATGCSSGIANREGGDCTGNSIINNKVKANNTERTIWVQSNNTIIAGNDISGGYYAGILMEGASYCSVSGNNLKGNTRETNNAYAEIWIKGSSTNNNISGNIISSGTNIAHDGILIEAGSNNNKLTTNIFNGVTTTYNDSGTDTLIIDSILDGGSL